jgi:hypothetical protein
VIFSEIALMFSAQQSQRWDALCFKIRDFGQDMLQDSLSNNCQTTQNHLNSDRICFKMRTLYAPSHNAGQLMSVLRGIEAVPLQGLALIECPSLLADRAVVRDAVLELIAYTGNCSRAALRLADVPPVPLTTFVPVEWAL